MTAGSDDGALAAAAQRLQSRFTDIAPMIIEQELENAYESLVATARISMYVTLFAERQAAEALERLGAQR